MNNIHMTKEMIGIRGAGDVATGVIQKFARSGYRIFAMEIDKPTTIRRQVALSAAMLEGETQVEDIRAKRAACSEEEFENCWNQGIVPIVNDASGKTIARFKPAAVIDAILAKRNLGTHLGMAPVTIGLGPGFSAGEDVDLVIETMRGHRLGRIIEHGAALPNTGIPGEIGGQSIKRVMHAPQEGIVKHFADIGDWVKEGQPVFQIGESVVKAPFEGMVRGLIAEGIWVKKGLKTSDIDPRKLEREEAFRISDKARCIGGAALEAYLYLLSSRRNS